MKVTLGGDRLGSGNKQKLELSHYYRSTFNLEQDFKSSLAPGILYPCLNLVGTNGDEFDIDIDSIFRTIPTKAPLFGSFKAQIDIFACPFRLYQGILHNNPVDIGLKMSQVYLPKILIKAAADNNAPVPEGADFYTQQISTSSLLKYLGLSGIGYNTDTVINPSDTIERKINAIPVLAYYDIFKNYYSNKQEEKAYVLTPGNVTTDLEIAQIMVVQPDYQAAAVELEEEFEIAPKQRILIDSTNALVENFTLINANSDEYTFKQLIRMGYLKELDKNIYWDTNTENHLAIEVNENIYEFTGLEDFRVSIDAAAKKYVNSNIVMKAFDLANIDKMRNKILKLNELGDELVIGSTDGTDILPYSTLTDAVDENKAVFANAFKQNGLVVKTYQSDLFNNWINTDWIDGENGIAALSSVDVSDGALNMDALNLAQKVYNMLNRIAVSGGTYEDWQEAVYDEQAIRKAESPMYCGGMSAEIMFEEILSTAETKVDGDYQPLGSMGGRGKQVNKNGGNNITIKCKEPTFIMGIVSLTPRICQTQGNEWYLTDLDTLNDLHKPGLDGIGFQDLIGEQMAWWDTALNTVRGMKRGTIGKVPAWINYQTAVDKAYGDFAEASGKAFMVLARNYEMEMKEVSPGEEVPVVKDFTTYIDPAKYNYAFAYTDLAAQNFWSQIHFKVIARRKMSAHQIPNL